MTSDAAQAPFAYGQAPRDYPEHVSIIALHGNGGGGFRFARLIPFMPAGMQLIAPTLPGFAHKPADPSLQTLADYAGYLQRRVLHVARPRILLGHGVGGAIALEYAQHYPESLDALILHAPVGAKLEQRRFPKVMQLPGMPELGKRVFASPLARPLLRRMLFSQPIPEGYLQRFFEEYQHCQVFAQMFSLITSRWFAGLKPVPLPTLLLWGAEERVLKSNQAEHFRRLLPRSNVAIIPGWDHFPMIETPQDYVQVLRHYAPQLLQQAKLEAQS